MNIIYLLIYINFQYLSKQNLLQLSISIIIYLLL